jgi:hypothetical protein
LALLFHRRHVWLPTVWGLAVLFGALAVAGVALVAAMPSFLAITEPARGVDGRGARLLIVEGWLTDAELDQAAATFRRGRYERIVTSGGPIEVWMGMPAPWQTFAERGERYLATHGLADAGVTAIAAPASMQERTYVSAVAVRDWAAGSHLRVDAVDVYTAGVHARRTRAMFRAAFGPQVEVGVIAARPSGFDARRWWTSSAGTKLVLGETISLAWTACCFWPPAAPAPPSP